MNSHLYLFRTSMKNRVKELIHKPGKLMLYLLIIAVIVFSLIMSLVGASHSEATIPVSYLLPAYFAFLLLFYGIAIQKGLASGNSIFEMSDVNLLFVSPVNPRATLLYGLIRLIGTSFWAGFFLLFQSSTLANFGVDFSGVFILFGTFILNLVVLTLLSLVIYSVTNGKPGRKLLVKILAIAIFLPLLAFFLVRFAAAGGNPISALNDMIEVPILAATPFVGWTSAGAISFLEGNLLAGFGWLGLLALTGAGMFLYIMLSRSDYYEDVLIATETAFEKKRAAAEGDLQMSVAANARGKVTGTGLGGMGAHVFLYKHLRETFRQNRFGFFSMYTVIATGVILALSFFLRGKMDIITVLQVLMWIQVFMIGTGRGLLETYSHYIYMIPVSPFTKLLWSNMELMLRSFIESLLFFAVPGLVLGSNPLVILGCIAVYTFFSLLLLGINYLFMRWVGANLSQGILLMIYFFAVLIFLAPGLSAALFVGFTVGGFIGTLAALGILFAWELIVALACFALSKNVLHNCDMSSVRPK